MRTLYLFRHAKSDWSDPGQQDFDRPLSPRGRKAAPLMGRWMARHRIAPARVLSSPAVRARETCRLAFAELSAAPDVRFEPALYLAGPERILDLVRTTPDAVASLMIVGHNPGLHMLAIELVHSGHERDIARLHAKFPTAGFAEIALPVDRWPDIAPQTGRLARFVTPRDLAE
jgi:phosphohistidine phosphatase